MFPYLSPLSFVATWQVGMKPDLQAVAFSPQSAYFFAHVSQIAYKPEHEARGLVVGNSTSEGLGFDRFHWFEVRIPSSSSIGPTENIIGVEHLKNMHRYV